MTIAIIGWGSLIWETDTAEAKEFIAHTRGQWNMAKGLNLPLEFSRISRSRQDALTLVIDENHGTNCPVRYIASKRKDLNDVICDLRCREKTVWRHIGHWSYDGRTSHHAFSNRIGEWAASEKFTAAVWTALPSNYRDKKGIDFNVESAIRHLQELSPQGKRKAEQYITNAPSDLKTKLRINVDAESPFT